MKSLFYGMVLGKTAGAVLTVFLLLSASQSYAAFSNLVLQNPDFEDSANLLTGDPGIIDDLVYEAAYDEWSTGVNSFNIKAQGFDAPSTFSDTTPTGQYLAIRGEASNGQITMRISIPDNINIQAGAAARLQFQAWSLDNGATSYQNTGTIRVRVNNVAVAGLNTVQVDTQVSAWTLNTYNFNVSPNDSVDFQWRDSGPGNSAFGMRIDDVQLLVDIAAVPEPSLIGAAFLCALMTATYLRKRRKLCS